MKCFRVSFHISINTWKQVNNNRCICMCVWLCLHFHAVPQSVRWGFGRQHSHLERLGVKSWTAFLCTSTKPIILRRNYGGDSPSCVVVCEHYVYLGLNTCATASIKNWWCLFFVNFCSKLNKLWKIHVCAQADRGTLCYHKKKPGVYGISALACSQGRGLQQQQCSRSLLGISRAGELMPSNPLISLNMTSADREWASCSFKSSHQHFVYVD